MDNHGLDDVDDDQWIVYGILMGYLYGMGYLCHMYGMWMMNMGLKQ